ncbi:MAG: ion transporter [Bacteroidota bacterium]
MKGKYQPLSGWRKKLHEIVYEADTTAGKVFDISLLVFIILSVVAVMLESVPSISGNEYYHNFLLSAEWFFTIVFTIEYIARIIAISKASKYIFSFYGIIDFLSTIPGYFIVFGFPGQNLLALRALRLLRVFRILKLARYLNEARTLRRALIQSRPKITVFLFAVLMVTIILGTLMYLIEEGNPNQEGFVSIPESIYWAIVTLTTVGYGDITPQTPIGQAIAAMIMIIGYAIIAVPTGIVSAEMVKSTKEEISTNTQACMACSKEGHEDDADYCKYCGEKL